MPDISEQQLNELAEQIARRIRVSCECGLSEEARREMPHLLCMVRDIGGNDHSAGVEILREMGKRYSRMSKTSEYISKAIMVIFLAAMFGGFVSLLKIGITGLIRGIRG